MTERVFKHDDPALPKWTIRTEVEVDGWTTIRTDEFLRMLDILGYREMRSAAMHEERTPKPKRRWWR